MKIDIVVTFAVRRTCYGMRRRLGQTLAEMLVAIGIMAVVIGLLLSVFIQLIRMVKAMQH